MSLPEPAADGARPSERLDGDERDEERWEQMPEERRIAAEMRSAGMSVEAIAEELNRDHSTVWRWLNRDASTMEYLHLLNEERRERWALLALQATQEALEAVAGAVREGDTDAAMKWLSLVMRDDVARERLWLGP
jgi:methylphosphotriester-DNA--protein-cysteine methyltransferase